MLRPAPAMTAGPREHRRVAERAVQHTAILIVNKFNILFFLFTLVWILSQGIPAPFAGIAVQVEEPQLLGRSDPTACDLLPELFKYQAYRLRRSSASPIDQLAALPARPLEEWSTYQVPPG